MRPVVVVIAAKAALTLAVSGRYGWHRDELYYAVAGRHLQGGYVEFPPVTALVAALARELFGPSLVGLRSFTVLAAAGTVLVAALVACELGATRRAQTLAAFLVAFVPGALATDWLFQPVAFDQLTTIVVLWLALRLALGRGSWLYLGLAAGVGLETKYTIAVVLVLLVGSFLVWRRDVLRTRGFLLAVGVAALLLAPNLLWQAEHGWTSVQFFLHPPPSGSDETRTQFVLTLALLAAVAVPVAVAGVVSLVRDRALRPLGWTVVGTVLAYLVLGGKSYYVLPVMLFALAAGSLPLDRWLTTRRSGSRPPRSSSSTWSSSRFSCPCCRSQPPNASASSSRAATTSPRSAGPSTSGRSRSRPGTPPSSSRRTTVRRAPSSCSAADSPGRVTGRHDALLAPAGQRVARARHRVHPPRRDLLRHVPPRRDDLHSGWQ